MVSTNVLTFIAILLGLILFWLLFGLFNTIFLVVIAGELYILVKAIIAGFGQDWKTMLIYIILLEIALVVDVVVAIFIDV